MKKLYIFLFCFALGLFLAGSVSAALVQPEFLRRSSVDTNCVYLIQPDTFKLGIATTTCGSNKLYVNGATVINGTLTVNGTSTLATTTVSYLIVSSLVSLTGNLNMNNNLILNIGDANTDFTSGGGLNLGGALTYIGSARPVRTIMLDVNTATIYADGASNVGTATIDHDNTNHRNFAKWTSGTATQDIDFVFTVKLPANFSAWATTTNSLSVDTRTNDISDCPITIFAYDATGTVDSGINGAVITPPSNNAWATKTDDFTNSYAAGDWIHIHIHLVNGSVSDTASISRLFLSYLATN